MITTRIKDRFQITIPKKIRQELQLEIDDMFEVELEEGKIILTPHILMAKPYTAVITGEAQKVVKSLQEKMDAITKNQADSGGLTEKEAKLAVKTGLIEPEEAWWWREEWQKVERSSRMGDKSEPIEGKQLLDKLDEVRRSR